MDGLIGSSYLLVGRRMAGWTRAARRMDGVHGNATHDAVVISYFFSLVFLCAINFNSRSTVS
jgi:hypothetical protein